MCMSVCIIDMHSVCCGDGGVDDNVDDDNDADKE